MTPGAASRPALIALAFVVGCGMPRDPEGTLDDVRGGLLRVGVIESPPWASQADGGAPRGVEVALVERLADELGARVRWVAGGESKLMEALERFELDLVIGGIVQDTPWKNRVALSRPFHVAEVLIGGPEGTPAVEDLSGRRVAVHPASRAAALVRDRGAEAVEAADPSAVGSDLVAVPRWEVEAWDLAPVGPVLETRAHVLGLPPGENGWRLRVDRFLARNRDAAAGLLRAEAAR